MSEDKTTGDRWASDQDEGEAQDEAAFGAAAGDVSIAEADPDYVGAAPLDPALTDRNTDYDPEVDAELLDEPGRDVPVEDGPAASVEDFEPLDPDPEAPRE